MTQVDEKGHEGNTAEVTAYFCWRKLFVSPVQPALLSGSPRIDGFHILDYRSHRVKNKGGCSCGLFNYDSFVSLPAIGVIWGI